MRKLRTFDSYLDESLKDAKEAALYLTACAEEDDPVLLLDGLMRVAKVHGISKMAKRGSMTRMGLYKTLSKKGNPEFKTLLAILNASGIQLAFVPKKAA